MKKNLLRIIVVLSVSLLEGALVYLVIAGLDFTDCLAPGRKWGMFVTIFVLLALHNFVLAIIYVVSERKSLEIKRPE